jgi:hypothetical protein
MAGTKNKDGHMLDLPRRDQLHHDSNTQLHLTVPRDQDRNSTTMRRHLNSMSTSISRTIMVMAMTTAMGEAMNRGMTSNTTI